MTKKILKISQDKECALLKELEELKNIKLPDVADKLESSRESDFSEEDTDLGRLLEDKEYYTNRISEIGKILRTAEIIKDKNHCTPDKVELGSVVKLLQGDKKLEIKIVSSIEADPLKNHISDVSPLGKKLMKGKVGDEIDLSIRGEKTIYKILVIC